MKIDEFREIYQPQVVDLIVGIQRDEFGLGVTAEQQSDLFEIPEYYQRGKGNFWVALEAGRVIGTISLRDIGHDEAALRKMFVAQAHRGSIHGVAQRLLDTLLGWARANGIKTIYLGTIEEFRAAHRFYERNGFARIGKEQLPASFPLMGIDTRFYRLMVVS